MDFFEAQEQAKRKTGLLIFLFGAAMVAIAVGIYLVVLVAFGLQVEGDPVVGHGVLFLGVAFLTWVVIGLASLFRTAQLRKGGSAVATLLGGRQVDMGTPDPDERRLVNVVEEMSIASGTPVPDIFVLDRESSINAFAAGHTIHDAAVAVTRGTLEKLNRDELQGVVAHEFSHILNGDMRLNIRLIGLLFGILFLAIVGRGFLRGGLYGGGRRRGGSGGQAMAIGLALVLLGYIGLFFGRLIKAAVSRQREFLADAAAVTFTRNPLGIAGALRKIQDHPSGGKIEDHHAEEASHLFFASGLTSAMSRAMATHPPLEERLRRIDASGMSRAAPPATRVREAMAGAEGAKATGPAGGAAESAGAGGAAGAAAILGAAVIMGSVGAPGREHVEYARNLLERIPGPVRDAAHDPDRAPGLVLALVGEGEEATASARAEAARRLGVPEAEVESLTSAVRALGPEARLPLLDLCLPSLRSLAPEEAATLRSAVEGVIRADGEVRPFDLALVHILWRHLPREGKGKGESRRGSASLRSLRRPLETLLSTMARAGADDDDGTRAAFQAALKVLPREVSGDLSLRPPAGARLSHLDDALTHLEQGTLDARRAVLEACTAAVLADREVRTVELELLRAVAESLQTPLPPVIAGNGVG
jgi:Zn-dependent protease with chaperone function